MKKLFYVLFALIAICVSANASVSLGNVTLDVEQYPQGTSTHSKLVALIEQQNEYFRNNVVENNGIRIKPIIIGSESEKIVTFEYETNDNVYNYSNGQLKKWGKNLKKVQTGVLKQLASTDEMTRLMIEGGYTFRYVYYDKHGKVMQEFTIEADDLK